MGELARRPALISPEEYLQREELSPIKHEFVDGVMYAMAGASERHNLVAGNLFALLHTHVREQCKVFIFDMKLRVRAEKATVFYYPDLMVSCAASDPGAVFHERPILLCEVLSPSTERTDRTEKFDAYTRIPELQEYVLADQDTPTVEIFRRRTSWKRETYYIEDSLVLESVDLPLAVSAIYRQVF